MGLCTCGCRFRRSFAMDYVAHSFTMGRTRFLTGLTSWLPSRRAGRGGGEWKYSEPLNATETRFSSHRLDWLLGLKAESAGTLYFLVCPAEL